MDTVIKTRKHLSNVQIASRIFLLTLAGGVIAKLLWTNSNTHDPGVTTPEALDYSVSDVDSGELYDPYHKKHKRD